MADYHVIYEAGSIYAGTIKVANQSLKWVTRTDVTAEALVSVFNLMRIERAIGRPERKFETSDGQIFTLRLVKEDRK